MTKKQAIDRVNKLRALAKGTTNANERRSAAERAREIMREHQLTDADLKISDKVTAFDELVSTLDNYASRHPDLTQGTFGASEVVRELLGHAKTKIPRDKKAVFLDRLSQGIDLAKLLFGNSNKTLRDVAGIVDAVKKNHGV